MVQKLQENITNFMEKLTTFSQKEGTKALFFIIICIICLIFGFYEIKKPAFTFITFLMVKKIKGLPKVKSFLVKRKSDQDVIALHWVSDRDLVYLKFLNRFLLVIAFSLILGALHPLLYPSVEGLGNKEILADSVLYLKSAMLVYFVVLVIYLLADFHIILCRNFPVASKLMSMGESSVKYIVAGTGLAVGYTDITSRISFIEPSPWGNWWQEKFGRGYGFKSSLDFQRNEVLKATIPDYDPSLLVDKKSGLIDSGKMKAFIDLHKEEIRKKESLVTCQLLSINQNRYF